MKEMVITFKQLLGLIVERLRIHNRAGGSLCLGHLILDLLLLYRLHEHLVDLNDLSDELLSLHPCPLGVLMRLLQTYQLLLDQADLALKLLKIFLK
jgi:hypothetical protein